MPTTSSRRSVAIITTLLLAAGASAQQLSFRSGELEATVSTGAGCPAGCGQTVAAGPGATSFAANASCHATGATATAVTSMGRVAVSCSNGDLGTAGTCFAVPGAAVEVVVRFSSPTPIAGTLRLDEGGRHINYTAFVDVGDDGSLELESKLGSTCSCPIDVPVVLTSNGLDVRIGATLSGPNESVFVDATFAPNASGLATFAVPCQSELAGYLAAAPGAAARWRMIGTADPNAVGALFVLGTAQANIPLPSLGCALGVGVLVPLVAPVSSDGAASADLRVPQGVAGSVYTQLVWYGIAPAGSWRTSNVLQASF